MGVRVWAAHVLWMTRKDARRAVPVLVAALGDAKQAILAARTLRRIDRRAAFAEADIARHADHPNKDVAKMIRAEMPTRVYYVNLGGFDTHAQQANKHTQLLTQFAESMKAFYDELHQTGHDGRVVSLAFSEFGRRLRQNASGGTDHGVAGPSFVFGPPVAAGVHGRYPSLTDLDQGDLIHTIDFRGVYADLLDNWMRIDSATALGARFDHVGLIKQTARA